MIKDNFSSFDQTTVKRIIFVCVLLLLAIGASSLSRSIQPAAAGPALAAATVKTEGATLLVGASTTVDLIIDTADNQIGAATVELSYDATLFSIESCSQSAFIGACNIDEAGNVLITGIQASGVTGNAVLGSFEIKALKAGSGDFSVDEVSVLADTSGDTVESIIESGQIVINEAEVPTATPLPPTATPEEPSEKVCSQLLNGDFEDGLNNWAQFGELELVDGRTGSAITVANGSARQQIEAGSEANFTLVAYIKIEGEIENGWTGIGLDYLDNETELGEESLQLQEVTDGFAKVEVSGTTAAGTNSIQVWMFTNSDITFAIDDIELIWEGCDEVEPTPVPTATPEEPVEPTATPEEPVEPTATPEEPVEPTATPEVPVEPTATPEGPGEPLEAVLVYDDAVSADWVLSKWGTTTFDSSSTSQIFEGEFALEVTLENDQSTLYFEANDSLLAEDYVSLTVMLYGTAEGQQIDLGLMDANFQSVGSTMVSIVPGEWTAVEFELDQLDAGSKIHYITFEDPAAPNAAIFIDNLALNRISDGTTGTPDNLIYLPLLVK